MGNYTEIPFKSSLGTKLFFLPKDSTAALSHPELQTIRTTCSKIKTTWKSNLYIAGIKRDREPSTWISSKGHQVPLT